MPVITRVPIVARPDTELPDPSQALVLLREELRTRYARLILATGAGAAAALALVAALADLSDASGQVVTAVSVTVALLGLEWWDVRARLRRAEPMVEPVVLMHPQLGRNPRSLAILALSWAAVTAVARLGDAELVFAGVTVGYLPRATLMDGWLALRERRERRHFLQRVDLPDDDLLHASPDQVRAIESRHA